MRILFTPLASSSHVLPMVTMAWACRAAGHDVRFAAQPRVVGTISGCGMSAVAVGESCDLITEILAFFRENAELLRPGGRLTVSNGAPAGDFAGPWIKSAAAVAPDLIAFGRWWQPDLLVTDPMFYAGPILSEVLGIPLVRNLWGPDWTMAGLGMGGRTEGAPAGADWPEDLVRLYESYGVPVGAEYAACTLDPYPPSLQVPGLANRVTMRQVPFNGSGVLPDWLAEPPKAPRVLVTFGTANTEIIGQSAFLAPRVLPGIAGLDVEIVLAVNTADRALVGEVPPGTRVVENLPFDALLPSCSALVSHGGAGGMITAATHGVPQVLIPLIGDQASNSRLLAATGAGIQLDAPSLDAGQVRAAVESVVFDDGPRAAARKVQEEIRSLSAPSEVVATLENLVLAGAA